MGDQRDKERINKLLDTVMKVARGDYSVQNELSGESDDLDALAMGLNMMIDDLRNNVNLKSQNNRIRAINDELKKAKKKAQESDRLKSAFLANMSHEIRTPMNAIMGFSTMLRRSDISPEKQKKFYAHIENAGNQLMTLIDDILDLSKIESNQLKIHKYYCNVNDLLEQVFEIVKHNKRLIAKPDIQLVYHNGHYKDYCIVNTDQVRFKQIFINLMNNAIKFTEKGRVELGYSLLKKQNKDIVKLYVKDTGIGISDDLKDVIFERFRQVDNDQIQEGAGLGLSITKGLVDLLGGEISLESKSGTGTVFHVSFPCLIDQKNANKEKGNAQMDLSPDLSDYTVYIAEDTLISYILLEEILEPFGIKMKQAENGKELIDLIEKQIPDLVLLDIRMPVMNGYEVMHEFRRRKYTFPVIAQTAYASDEERKQILNSGCKGYISKPVNPDMLIREIKKHLRINS